MGAFQAGVGLVPIRVGRCGGMELGSLPIRDESSLFLQDPPGFSIQKLKR